MGSTVLGTGDPLVHKQIKICPRGVYILVRRRLKSEFCFFLAGRGSVVC